MLIALLLLASYLLGSVSSAILVTRLWTGKDIRTLGTRNAGGTNVAREVGLFPALLVALFDVLKGMLPVISARLLELGDAWGLLAAIAATLGHSFPLYFNFRGGKGMACAIGALLVLTPVEGILYISVFFSVFLVLTGSAVTGGLVALPLLMGLLAWRGHSTFIIFTPLIFLLVMGFCALPEAIADYRNRPVQGSLIGFWLKRPSKNQPQLFTQKQDFVVGSLSFVGVAVLLVVMLPLSGMTGWMLWIVALTEAMFVMLLIVWGWKKVKK